MGVYNASTSEREKPYFHICDKRSERSTGVSQYLSRVVESHKCGLTVRIINIISKEDLEKLKVIVTVEYLV